MMISDVFYMEMPLKQYFLGCLLFACIAFMHCKCFICLSFACKCRNAIIIGNYVSKFAKVCKFLFACCLSNQLIAGERGA